jgi:hypothetical protein
VKRSSHIEGIGPLFRCLLLVGITSLSACSVVGPTALSGSRGLYNEVINRTEDEQILNMVVRQRYDETFGMLAVASVTASIRAEAQATADFALGDDQNYINNLVPLQAGVAYEESPTIAYVPLGGETFIRRMLAPVSLEHADLVSRGSMDQDVLLRTLIRRVNGLRDSTAGEDGPSARFERVIELYTRLEEAEVLDLVREYEFEDYYVSLHDYKPSLLSETVEFLSTLGIRDQEVDGREIVLPLRLSIGRASTDAIDLETRSVFEIIRVIGQAIEIPPPHLSSGLVAPNTRETSEAEQFLIIRSSANPPSDAAVRIKFRDWWFYIDASDTQSKQGFVILRTLIGMRLEETPADQAPVLTIPVGGG